MKKSWFICMLVVGLTWGLGACGDNTTDDDPVDTGCTSNSECDAGQVCDTASGNC